MGKKEAVVINGVRVYPTVTMKEAGSQAGMLFVFLIMPFYALLIPLMAPEAFFGPDVSPSVLLMWFGLLVALVVAAESVGYYSFQRWLQGKVIEAVYLDAKTKIGKYEVREKLRVVEVVLYAEPKEKKEKKKKEKGGGNSVTTVALEGEEAPEELEAGKLALLPGFKTLRIGDKYMYHLLLEDGVRVPLFGRGGPERDARFIIMPFPWEELGFGRDSDIFEYGLFLTGRSAEVYLVHVGYMYSVVVEKIVPVFYVYLSDPHRRQILEKNFRLPEEANIEEVLRYIHRVDKHQAQELQLLLREVEKERDLYRERYTQLFGSQLEVAEDMAAEIINIWLEGIESTEKLFGKSLAERMRENWMYIALVVGLLGVLAVLFFV